MTIHLEWADAVCKVIIDRPQKRNAVDLQTLREILRAQQEAQQRSARVLVIAGAAPAFCSGADVVGAELGEFTETLSAVLRGLGSLRCLSLAAVDGPALGAGAQMAAACDLRMATPSSTFGIPAAKLGLAVDTWTTQRVGREAGWSVARFMLLTGESLTARELLGGFVHKLGTVSEAMLWAQELAQLAPLTIAAHKLTLEKLGGADVSDEIIETARLAAWASADASEGRSAFIDKRAPRFTGE